MHAIERFEAARRSLGHAALLSAEEIAEIRSEPRPMKAMCLMANALVAARERHMREYGHVPVEPVLPVVDIAGMQVVHVTCTGNTELRLLPPRYWAGGSSDWSFQAVRRGPGTLAEAHPDIAALDAR